MLEVVYVSKNYGQKEVLKNINLSFKPGEIVGIFGENGAGKSTLINCIMGFVTYDGSVKIDGVKVGHNNIEQLAYASCEHTFFGDMTADSNKEFYKDHFTGFNEKRYKSLMQFFNLPNNVRIDKLSVGQQNQFEMILALCQGAKYILLDEPFANSDILNREDLYKLLLGILEEDETIILSTHLIDEVDTFINRAIFMRRGEIIDDKSIDSLYDKGETLLGYFKKRYNYKSDRVAKTIETLQ